MSEKQNLISTLKQLAFKIKEEVNDSHSKGSIQPDMEPYYHWKVDKFQYTEEGVTESSAHGEYITKKSWFRAHIKIEEPIKKSDEYSSALELLTNIIERKNKITHELERFTTKLILRYLDDSKFSDADVDLFVTNFLKDVKEEPLKYGAEVELDGIVILPERIEFKIGDTNIILRQTRIEDLEKAEEDKQKLKKFWQTMIKTLPPSFYELGETRLDHITIAYKRYCDALLQNGVLERRIANTVMGLESLFLKGGETQELIYRLSIRIAKIFSLLRYDSYKVKEIVRRWNIGG